MKIFETLDRDPRSVSLANNGQARIDGAAAELRAELETFVCEGQFSDAIQRILESYFTNLTNPRQNSAWVSGFFGSGKSHLLKMLEHLWVNTPFPDGSTARSLVHGGLPIEIKDQLRELDTLAARSGKPVAAAAGTLLAAVWTTCAEQFSRSSSGRGVYRLSTHKPCSVSGFGIKALSRASAPPSSRLGKTG